MKLNRSSFNFNYMSCLICLEVIEGSIRLLFLLPLKCGTGLQPNEFSLKKILLVSLD